MPSVLAVCLTGRYFLGSLADERAWNRQNEVMFTKCRADDKMSTALFFDELDERSLLLFFSLCLFRVMDIYRDASKSERNEPNARLSMLQSKIISSSLVR